MNVKRIRCTQEGYDKLKQEYDELLQQRPAVVEDLKKAREMGDLSENGYYKASRAKLSFVDGRLFRLKTQIKQAWVVDVPASDVITIGTKVTLQYGDKESIYTIVGDLEANPTEGKISLLSPLGKAVEGKQEKDTVKLLTPRGEIIYTITSIMQ